MRKTFETLSKHTNKNKEKPFQINTETPSDQDLTGPNSHINNYLNYYLSLKHSPYFATLISGPWGVGKTHIIKSILKDFLGDTTYSYVSLYGIERIDDIDAALYQSLHPILASTGAKVLGRIGKAAMKYGRIDGIVRTGDFINPTNDRLYVFDDLERCKLSPEIVLGYINELVEHDGCKVIIIANEKKLLENKAYQETREKLIGKTLEAQPAIDGALKHFLEKASSDRAKKVMTENAGSISKVFKEARARNFRVLQQTIWDFERVIDCLGDQHLENKAGIKALLSTFFAISIEVKAGFLSEEDISKRPNQLLRAMFKTRTNNPEPPLEIAQKQFSEANLYDTILNNQVLTDLLFKGIISNDSINESINHSNYFPSLSKEPAWRTVWHAFEREETAFQEAFAKMELQFQNREIIETGVLLHIFGMRLWLSDIGVLSLPRDEILAQTKSYIDHLYSEKLLSPYKNIDSDYFQGYGGLGIHEIESSEFITLLEHLKKQLAQSEIDSYPQKAEKLLEEMRSDVSLFYRRINFTNSEDNIYSSTPLLPHIPPNTFVAQVLNLKGDDRRRAIAALNSRYSTSNLDGALAAEKDWLTDVISEFNTALENLSPISRWGISGALKHYLDPLISEKHTGSEENPTQQVG